MGIVMDRNPRLHSPDSELQIDGYCHSTARWRLGCWRVPCHRLSSDSDSDLAGARPRSSSSTRSPTPGSAQQSRSESRVPIQVSPAPRPGRHGGGPAIGGVTAGSVPVSSPAAGRGGHSSQQRPSLRRQCRGALAPAPRPRPRCGGARNLPWSAALCQELHVRIRAAGARLPGPPSLQGCGPKQGAVRSRLGYADVVHRGASAPLYWAWELLPPLRGGLRRDCGRLAARRRASHVAWPHRRASTRLSSPSPRHRCYVFRPGTPRCAEDGCEQCRHRGDPDAAR